MSNLAALRNVGTAAAVNDNTLVHLAGAETITGAKTLSANLTISKNDPVLYLDDNAPSLTSLFYTNEGGVHKWGRTGTAYDMTLSGAVLSLNGNLVWHVGNDGAGSGLDADLLDGLQGSAFGQLASSGTWTAEQFLNGGFRITNAVPSHYHKETGAGADAKLWKDVYFGGQYLRALVNDAESAQNVIYSETRTGYASAVAEYFLTDLRITVAPSALATNSAGFRSAGPESLKTGNYTFVATDEGRATDMNAAGATAMTINTGVHTANAVLYGANRGAGTMTLTRGAGVEFRDAAGVDANLAVGQYQQWSARRQGTTDVWYVRVF